MMPCYTSDRFEPCYLLDSRFLIQHLHGYFNTTLPKFGFHTISQEIPTNYQITMPCRTFGLKRTDDILLL